MSAADEIWRDFQLDPNCVPVTGENKVRIYFAQMRRALGGLRRCIERGTSITNAERHSVEHFVLRLQQTFEILALRHFYPEAGPDLKLDTTDSGFVHFSALL